MTRRTLWLSLAALAAGVVVVMLLVAQDQLTIRVELPVAAGDERFLPQVASLLGAPVTAAGLEVLVNGERAYPAMLAAIEQARHRIGFESYIYTDGEVAQRFTGALAAAAQRGADVRVVLDAVGAADLSAAQRDALARAGAQLLWFNELHPWLIESANYRTHRKLLVVDGEVAFTGGIGVGDQWLGDAGSEDEWRDTQFRLTGPILSLLEGVFYENWIESGGRQVPAIDPAPAADPGMLPTLLVWSGATGGASPVKMLFLLSIAGARESIDIQSPYLLLDESSFWALEQARRRGVRVRLLSEGEHTDAMPVKLASRHWYERLLNAGLEVYEYQPTMMHAKVMVVDGVWSVLGTANFNNRSLELNDELVIAVAGAPLAARLAEDFDADLARSRRIVAEEWRRRPLVERVRERFWVAFDEIF
ncbi:MAG TPA: phospholipase D-like domain-containing protein [Methylomirabilota bacterium]